MPAHKRKRQKGSSFENEMGYTWISRSAWASVWGHPNKVKYKTTTTNYFHHSFLCPLPLVSLFFFPPDPGVVVWMRNLPHRLMYLSTWSSVSSTIGEVFGTLGGRVLLEKVCHWLGGFTALPYFCMWKIPLPLQLYGSHLCFLKMFLVLVFDHSHSKLTYTSGFFWVKRIASRLGKGPNLTSNAPRIPGCWLPAGNDSACGGNLPLLTSGLLPAVLCEVPEFLQQLT